MADLLALDAAGRATAPEGKTREYKRDLSSPAKPLRTIVAFANSAGGQLVIGVADDGTVSGVADPLAEEERLSSLIADSIEPQLVPAIDLVTVDGATVLVVEVPLSTRRPHYMKAQGIDGGVYVRLGSTTRRADPALVAELERTARGVAFEDLPELRASLADLDLALLSDLRGRRTTPTDLVALGLAVAEGETAVPTNAGVLAACPDPTRFIPSAWVQCGRLRGPQGIDIFDQLEIHEPLPQAAGEVMAFLTKHAYKTGVFGQARRNDVYSIPLKAIREVVVNALVHASYAERGTPIRVGFYDSRIVIESPGGLVSGMTVGMMRGVSRLRNPSLARIFRDAGLIEQWGSGLNRVYDEIAAAGLPEPDIEEIVDRVRVTIYIDDHSMRPQSNEGDTYTRSKDRRHVGRYDVGMLSAAVDGPVHRDVLLEAVGLKPLSQNYTRHVVPLLEAGLLVMTVPDKPRSKAQRYRITPAGWDFLEGSK
ncbi:AAA family ATPase [Microbacterium protaetiae]|uniref:AAA family ATPase n=1 Tax=Microbacterium protaetiae TaxID=2509458 RepID=A0A4P6EEJ4_9MICO|nr:RNA-binding domain-containing protein [Microbacterium protaetiae]QAY59793.1 AAA family ATPase [Microbacterium protaetiae]